MTIEVTSAPFEYWNMPDYLQSLHTRQLMDLRKECHSYSGDAVWCGGPNSKLIKLEDINKELSTREHHNTEIK